jgi:hypothetical protein
MNREIVDTHHKALHINLDATKYGTFAEIGAGQEVARWFFRAGGAAGTIAKTMSAYDMAFSDAIYGPSDRYVSRQRLQTMLDHEFALMLERLAQQRGGTTKFFVFADTVAARSYGRNAEAHGWMGVRFQHQPQASPSDIIIHVRMLERENVQQQEALGIIGVNLVYGAFYLHAQPDTLIGSLLDNLTVERIEVDLIKFTGPAFALVDNRLMSLQLVHLGLAQAALFTAQGEVVQPAEVFYKKPILVERGSFRPPTKLTLDMLECARSQFLREANTKRDDGVVLLEITLRNLVSEGNIDHSDFLARVDILSALNQIGLISNYGEYYRLAGYLSRYTPHNIGIAVGIPTLHAIFEEKYYTHLEGGILESFGKLFRNNVKLYIHPRRDPATGELVTAQNFNVAPHLRHLYAHLLENHAIEPLQGINEAYLGITAAEVLMKLKAGDLSWETMVPAPVVHVIKARSLFGWQGREQVGVSG